MMTRSIGLFSIGAYICNFVRGGISMATKGKFTNAEKFSY